LGDVVGDHTVEPHRGDQEREPAEGHEHGGTDLPRAALAGQDFAHGLDNV